MVMQPLVPISASQLQTFLDTPEQLLQQSEELQLAIASINNTPRSLLEILVNSTFEQVAEAARLHINYAGEAGDNWQQLVDDILISRQMGQNDRLAAELLKIAPVPPNFLSKWVPANNLIQGLGNQYMPLRYRLKLLERLALEPTLEPRLQVAESPETPIAVLEQLAGDLELAIRLAVKFNPSSPPKLIELIERQYAVASDWNADIEQLAMLGRSSWDWIRLTVAQNPHTPQETLRELAGDSVYVVQLAVAKNPGTSAEILGILAAQEDTHIQSAIAQREDITEEIMHQLFPNHRRILITRKNLPPSILERIFSDRTDEKDYLFLRDANTPNWILAQLAQVDLKQLRVKVIEQIKASPIDESIEEGMLDATRFLADIAKHPQISVEILEHLTTYPNPDVQLAVAQSPLTPLDLKLRLLEDLSIDPDREIQVKVARDVNTPVQILEAMAQNEFIKESSCEKFDEF